MEHFSKTRHNTAIVDCQTHKYNGKELDTMHGLNLHDSQARQYDATIGMFTSMDPLCEKYYHISPYVYCGGNPVNRVDPDGKDVWTLSNIGEILEFKEDSQIDRIQIKDGGSVDFEYGTISGPKKNEINNLFSVKGDNAGSVLFEFLAYNVAPTNMEVGLLRIGEESTGKNYVGVSPYGKTGHEQAIAQCMNNGLIDTGAGVREHIHSHPGGTVTPSGMPGAKNGGSDRKAMHTMLDQWHDCKFALYIPMYQTGNSNDSFYVPYSKDSKSGDFDKYEKKYLDIINSY